MYALVPADIFQGFVFWPGAARYLACVSIGLLKKKLLKSIGKIGARYGKTYLVNLFLHVNESGSNHVVLLLMSYVHTLSELDGSFLHGFDPLPKKRRLF